MLKSDSNSSVDAAAGASRPRWDAVADLRLHVGRLSRAARMAYFPSRNWVLVPGL